MNHRLKKFLHQPLNPLTIAIAVSSSVILISWSGIFQVLEWQIFDQFFRLRFWEKEDENIVIVTIDEQDINQAGRWPITDLTLTQLLSKIKAQNPRVIGLDIFRDLPVEPGYDQLVQLMESTPNLIGIEKVSGVAGDQVLPPPTLAKLNQVAAADLISDADGKIRRALLSIKPEDSPTQMSLGTRLALTYLAQEDIRLEIVDANQNKFRLGKTTFSPLKKNDGGYINANVGGFQILLNYLNEPCNPEQSCAFTTVSMTDILAGKIDPNVMTDKVVLIGVTARSISDFFYNPYSHSDSTSINGVEIHAHITSLIINAAYDENYLFKVIPEYLEWLWILSWSTLGAIMSSGWVQRKNRGFYLLKLGFLLIIITYILFLFNWWIPLATPLIAFFFADTTALIYTLWKNLKISYQKLEKYASSLEEKVAEKTQDLSEKNLQLEIQNTKLAEARRMADTANEAKSKFLANMSHELRTPLNAIIGFSQLMNKDSDLNKNQREFVEIINRSGEHLLSLINDILDISKIEANKITLNEELFDLFQVLQTVQDMLIIRAQAKHLSFKFNIDKSVPQYIISDPKKLRQILINLLSNAIKFTHEGHIKLDVFLPRDSSFIKRKQPNQQTICFRVKDTGKGIEKDELPKLFKPFEQTQAGQQSHEGTGLGLTISRKFIELLGGEIDVKSKVDVGTTFSFYIEVKISEQSKEVAQHQNQQVISISYTQTEPKILIVDDVSENRRLLENILQPVGFQIQTASNGIEAIQLWQDGLPDLILMDIQMPEMNGYEAVEKIRQQEIFTQTNNGHQTKIIAVTASIFDDDEDKIYQVGFDDLIRKPFTENVVLEKLKSHLKLDYVYSDHQENEPADPSFNLNDLLEQKILQADLAKMPLNWRNQVINSANKGSDDELLDLITKIPPHLFTLQQVFYHLTNEFLFEEIIRLLSSLDD